MKARLDPGTKVRFFRTAADLRRWFEARHAKADELWVGYYRKSSGKPGVDWSQSVDEALCFGWIDGIRKSIDAESYANRFTPRRQRSVWSNVNIRRARALIEAGLMHPSGLRAFEARKENRSGIYSYEQRRPQLEEPYAGRLRAHRAASAFFDAQPPSYRKVIGWWIVSARKEETRLARLKKLIEACERGERVR